MVDNRTNKRVNFVGRLNKAISACRRLKQTTDIKNAKMLRAYASGYYHKSADKGGKVQDPHPLNMIDRAIAIWMPYLVGGLPKIIIEPKINLQFKPFAYTFQLALNQWIKDMKFAERTLEPAVFNSLFGTGIVKTGTHRADIKELAGYLTREGRPYAEPVDEPCYVFDIAAKDREQYEFEGDEYILPTKEAQEFFGSRFADKIKPDFKLYGEEHPREISNSEKIPFNELHEYSAFIDLWLPREKIIITILPPSKGFTKILKTTEYTGPATGPYDCLYYKKFPDSTIPIPPIYSLMELDAAINCLYAKARGQAERLKKIGVYEAGNERDAETARDAKDGQMCGFSNAQAIKDLTLGGVVPEIYNFLDFSLSQFSEQGANLAVAGGRRMMARTLGQEEMLMSNASRTLDRMSQRVHFFASNIAEKLAFEMWQNPTLQISAIKEIPGIAKVPVVFNQLEQEGNFPLDYYLDVELYSMQRLSPDAKFQKIFQFITSWILPTASIAAQQGKTLNVPEITKIMANYLNLETDRWFLSSQPMQAQMNPYQQMGSTATRSSDQRFGASEADNMNNLLAQQTAKAGRTTVE